MVGGGSAASCVACLLKRARTFKDWKQLKNLLAATDAPLEELQERWRHYLASTETFTVNKHGSLAYFCSNFDGFINGPLHERIGGGRNGRRLVGKELTRANLIAAGYKPLN